LRGGGGFELGNFGGKNETGGGDQSGEEAGKFHVKKREVKLRR
jgi:hypothetical protein